LHHIVTKQVGSSYNSRSTDKYLVLMLK